MQKRFALNGIVKFDVIPSAALFKDIFFKPCASNASIFMDAVPAELFLAHKKSWRGFGPGVPVGRWLDEPAAWGSPV